MFSCDFFNSFNYDWAIYLFYLLLIFSERERNTSIKLLNFFRTAVGFDWICAFWGSAGLPEKEPWIKRHLLQRPGCQTTNKSDVTAADEVCMANCWWNELLVLKICKLIVSSQDHAREKQTYSYRLVDAISFRAGNPHNLDVII